MYTELVFSSSVLSGIEQKFDQFLYLLFEVPLTRNYHYAASTLFLLHMVFFSPKILLDQSMPLLVSVGPTATDKNSGNVASVQIWCERTTLSRQFKIITRNDDYEQS